MFRGSGCHGEYRVMTLAAGATDSLFLQCMHCFISISRDKDGQDDSLMRRTNSCRQFTAHCSRLISAEYPTIATCNYIQGNARWTTTPLQSLACRLNKSLQVYTRTRSNRISVGFMLPMK